MRSIFYSSIVLLAIVHVCQANVARADVLSAVLGDGGTTTTSTTSATSTTSSSSTTAATTQTTTSTSTTTEATTTASPTSTTAPTTALTTTTSTTSTNTDAATTTTGTSTDSPTTSPTTTQAHTTVITTDEEGQQVTVTITPSGSQTDSSSAAASSTSAASDSSSSDSSGLSTGSIIGMSVAGGVALIGIISFFVWKFGRKRFTDYDADEAIKWPELNVHANNDYNTQPIGVQNTGRSNFGASDASLSRNTSINNNYSSADIPNDPYAVPPLPHLNPSQPYDPSQMYTDDPSATPAYYDPYRGPVPPAFSENDHSQAAWQQAGQHLSPDNPQAQWQASGEAIAMTQMSGRASPAMMGRVTSPGPQTGLAAGRASPGPQAAYGMPGRASPGPNVAYGTR